MIKRVYGNQSLFICHHILPCSKVRPMSTLLLLNEDSAELDPLCRKLLLPLPTPLRPPERSISDKLEVLSVGVRALVIFPGELFPLIVPSAFNVPGISTVVPEVFLQTQYRSTH